MNMIFKYIKSQDVRVLILCLAAMLFLSLSAGAQDNCTLVCKGDINATMDPATCEVRLTAADLTNATCDGAYTIEILTIANQLIASGVDEVVVSIPGDFIYRVTTSDGVPCWGNISIEDKSGPFKQISFSAPAPTIVCGVLQSRPSGINDLETELVSCMVEESGYSIDPWFDAIDADDFKDCSGIAEVFQFTNMVNFCDEPNYEVSGVPANWEPHVIYTRGWYAVDIDGNYSDTCYQDVVVIKPSASLITIPSHITKDCTDSDIQHEGPSFVDVTNDGDFLTCPQSAGEKVTMEEGIICGYLVSVHCDGQIPTCKPGVDNVYKQVCHWTVADWCDGTKLYDEFSQILDVKDDTAPTVIAGNAYFDSDPFDCTASLVVGPASFIEDCSGIVEWTTIVEYGEVSHYDGFFDRVEVEANGVSLDDIPSGAEVKITWRATDGCHNIGEISTMLSPMDESVPVCIANDEIIVGLIVNDPVAHTLAARVYAEDIDDSSYDNCQEIELLIRRSDEKLAYFAAGLDPEDLWAPYVEFTEEDLEEGACEATIKVELLVREARLGGLSTECFGHVTIENKTTPVAEAPADIYTDCTDHKPAFGEVKLWGGCDNQVEVETEVFSDDDCNYGYVYHARRKWTPFTEVDGVKQYGTPVYQTIKVENVHDVKIAFPIDMEVSCTVGDAIPAPLTIDDMLTDYGCGDWGVIVNDRYFNAEGQAGCQKIIREYEFTNWCNWDYYKSEIAIVNRPDDLILDDAGQVFFRYQDADLNGENDIDDADAADMDIYDQFAGYVNDGAFVLIDNFDRPDDLKNHVGNDGINGRRVNYVDGYHYGRFIYRQIIKITDEKAPELTGGIESVTCNPLAGNCDVVTDVVATFTATDECSDVDLSYQLIVGPTDEKISDPYGSISGNTITGTYPTGTHTFVVTARDGCNNITVKKFEFTAGEECKKPTPVCLATFTALMENGNIEIWASDIESGSSYDNCTAYEDLVFGIQIVSDLNNDGTISAADITNDMPSETVVYLNCAHLPKVYVALWARDEAGNTQYCITPIYITANSGECDGYADETAEVSGAITNEYDEEIENVMINVNGSALNAQASMIDGLFSFDVPMNTNVTIAPEKDDNYLNGVSTSDLVLLQRHILGVSPINSPYTLIAADANRDDKVDTRDLLQVSRLILGVYNELPTNTSWRFVDKNYTFANPTSPWGFAEVIDLSNLSADEQADFLGIKIGDVSGNAKASNLLGDDVKTGVLNIGINNTEVVANEVTEIAFRASDFNNVTGFQFSINLKEGVELVDVVPGVLPNVSEANFGLNHLSDGVLTTSWANATAIELANDEVLFTLKVNSNVTSKVSDLLTINSAVTTAEAYDNDLNVMNVHPLFIGAGASELTLYQNAPNPFSGETTIGFDLPESGAATLKVMDVSGRTIKVISGDYNKGYNQIELSKASLNTTGVLYYELTSSNATMVKKMVVLQ